MAGGEDEALARLCGRRECGAADGSACWHLAAGASAFLVGFHSVWGQRHKGELSCVSVHPATTLFALVPISRGAHFTHFTVRITH